MPKKKFEVEARISTKDKASKNVKKVEGSFKRLTKTIKASALAQVAAIAGVAIALRGMVRAIGNAITAANKQADAINALEGALAPLGAGVDKVSKALQAQAAALQKVTTFGDEEIIEAQALIASFIKEESQIKAATKATLDLAEAKGFSLVSAADLVSKTLGSSTNALTRYGIEVVGAVGSTERLVSLTENVATVFGGRAAKATETFSGKVKQLSNAWGDLLENVGEAITKNEGANESIDNLTKSVAEIAPSVAKFAILVLKLATAFGTVTAAIFEFNAKIIVGGAKLLGFLKIADDTGVSMDAMAAAAARQGISIEQLQRKLDASAGANRLFGQRTKEAADSMESATGKTKALALAQEQLRQEAKKSATAMETLGKALGEVTSAELAAEIRKIEKALDEARLKTGGFGEEFERLEKIATAKMKSLRDEARDLEDGLGALGDELDDTGESADDTGESFDELSVSVRSTTSALSQQATQARSTTNELRQLTGVAEQLALAEARTALAATQAQRKRISGVSSQRNVGRFTGFYVGPVGTFTVNPDGTLRPA